MTFSTRDTNLAAFLWVIHGPPDETTVSDGAVWFGFEGCTRAVKKDYYRGKTVPAVAFAERVKALRRMVREALEAQEE